MHADLLESFMAEKMSSTRLPGLSIALVRGDDVVYAKGFGVADIEQSTHATPETIYGAASITKSFVAIAILQLVERGLISLQDPVDKHLDWPLNNPQSRSVTKSGTGTIVLSGAQNHGVDARIVVGDGTLRLNSDVGSAAGARTATLRTLGGTMHVGVVLGQRADARDRQVLLQFVDIAIAIDVDEVKNLIHGSMICHASKVRRATPSCSSFTR
jgi:hypothetical protein